MDWNGFVDCQNCIALYKKLELFELLKQQCSKNDDVAKTVLFMKKSCVRSAKIIETKTRRLADVRSKLKDVEQSEELIKRKLSDYQLRLVTSDTKYQDLLKNFEKQQDSYSTLLKEKQHLKDLIELKDNDIACHVISATQTEERHRIDLENLNKTVRKLEENVRRCKVKQETQVKAKFCVERRYNRLVGSLLEIFKTEDVSVNSLKLKKIVSRLKAQESASKLEVELNTPSLTPDGTTSSDTGIFSGDEDIGSQFLGDDLQMSSDSSDDEFVDVQQKVDSITCSSEVGHGSISTASNSPLSHSLSFPLLTTSQDSKLPTESVPDLNSSSSNDSFHDPDNTLIPSVDLDPEIETNCDSLVERFSQPLPSALLNCSEKPSCEEAPLCISLDSKLSTDKSASIFDVPSPAGSLQQDSTSSLIDSVQEQFIILSPKNSSANGNIERNEMPVNVQVELFSPLLKSSVQDMLGANDSFSADSAYSKEQVCLSNTPAMSPVKDPACDLSSIGLDEDIPNVPAQNNWQQSSTSPTPKKSSEHDPISDRPDGLSKICSPRQCTLSFAGSHRKTAASNILEAINDVQDVLEKSKQQHGLIIPNMSTQEIVHLPSSSNAVGYQKSDKQEEDLISSLSRTVVHVADDLMDDTFDASLGANSKSSAVDDVEERKRENFEPLVLEESTSETSDVQNNMEADSFDLRETEVTMDSESDEEDVVSMLKEWASPTLVTPFSEDSLSLDGRAFPGIAEEQFSSTSTHHISDSSNQHISEQQSFSVQTCIGISTESNKCTVPDIQECQVKPQQCSPILKVTVGTNTEVWSGHLSKPGKSCQAVHSDASTQMPHLVLEQEAAILRSLDKATSPVRVNHTDVGLMPVEELRRTVSTSPRKIRCAHVGVMPIEEFRINVGVSPVKSGSVDIATSPVRTNHTDVGLMPIEELRRTVSTSPRKTGCVHVGVMPIAECASPVKNGSLDISTSPVKYLFTNNSASPMAPKDSNSMDLTVETLFRQEGGDQRTFGHTPSVNSEENYDTADILNEATVLRQAFKVLGINSKYLAGIALDKTILSELKQVVEITLKKASEIESFAEERTPLTKMSHQNFCSFDPCEFAELCNQQHHSLHRLAKSKNLENAMCSFGKVQKLKLKRLSKGDRSKRRKHLLPQPLKQEVIEEDNFNGIEVNITSALCKDTHVAEESSHEQNPVLTARARATTKEINKAVEMSPQRECPKSLLTKPVRASLGTGSSPLEYPNPLKNQHQILKDEISNVTETLIDISGNYSTSEACTSATGTVSIGSLVRLEETQMLFTDKNSARSDNASARLTENSPRALDNQSSDQETEKSDPFDAISGLNREGADDGDKLCSPSSEKMDKGEDSVVVDKNVSSISVGNDSERDCSNSCLHSPHTGKDPEGGTVTGAESDISKSQENSEKQLKDNTENNCEVYQSSFDSDSSVLEKKLSSRTPRKRLSISSESSNSERSSPENCKPVPLRRSPRTKKARVVQNSDFKASYQQGNTKFFQCKSVFVSSDTLVQDSCRQDEDIISHVKKEGNLCSNALEANNLTHEEGVSEISDNYKSSGTAHPMICGPSQGVSPSLSDSDRSNLKRGNEECNVTSSKRRKTFSTNQKCKENSNTHNLHVSDLRETCVYEKENSGMNKEKADYQTGKRRTESNSIDSSVFTSRSRTAPQKLSKLQKMRTSVSKVHPLAQVMKSMKSSNEEQKEESCKSKALKSHIPATAGRTDSKLSCQIEVEGKHIKTQADVFEKLRGRECVRMAAAASGRVAQLIEVNHSDSKKSRKQRLPVARSKAGSLPNVASKESRLQPLVRPEDRVSNMESAVSTIRGRQSHCNSPYRPSDNVEMPHVSAMPAAQTIVEPASPSQSVGTTNSKTCRKLYTDHSAAPPISLKALPKSSADVKVSQLPAIASFLTRSGSSNTLTTQNPLSFVISEQPCETTDVNKEELKRTEELVQRTLKEFVAAPSFTPAVLQIAINALSSSDLHYALPVIVRDIVKTMDNDFDTPPACNGNSSRNIPPLTPVQQKLLTLLIKLSVHHQHLQKLPHHVLRLLEFRVFRLVQAPEYKQLLWCARFYTSICRALCLRKEALIFCWDAMYALRLLSYDIIKTVLDVWPYLFPINPSFEKACPNAQVMVHLLRSHVDNPAKDHHMKKFDKCWLKFFLKSPALQAPSINSSLLVDKIFSNVIGGGSDLNVSALILLVKREEEQWALKNVISGKLLPALKKWQHNVLDNVTGERVIWSLCSILRPLSLERHNAMILAVLGVLKSELLQEHIPSHMQEVIAIGLALLSRHDIETVVAALKSWNPKHGPTTGYTPQLLQYLTDMVKSGSRHLNWWIKCKKTLEAACHQEQPK